MVEGDEEPQLVAVARGLIEELPRDRRGGIEVGARQIDLDAVRSRDPQQVPASRGRRERRGVVEQLPASRGAAGVVERRREIDRDPGALARIVAQDGERLLEARGRLPEAPAVGETQRLLRDEPRGERIVAGGERRAAPALVDRRLLLEPPLERERTRARERVVDPRRLGHPGREDQPVRLVETRVRPGAIAVAREPGGLEPQRADALVRRSVRKGGAPRRGAAARLGDSLETRRDLRRAERASPALRESGGGVSGDALEERPRLRGTAAGELPLGLDAREPRRHRGSGGGRGEARRDLEPRFVGAIRESPAPALRGRERLRRVAPREEPLDLRGEAGGPPFGLGRRRRRRRRPRVRKRRLSGRIGGERGPLVARDGRLGEARAAIGSLSRFVAQPLVESQRRRETSARHEDLPPPLVGVARRGRPRRQPAQRDLLREAIAPPSRGRSAKAGPTSRRRRRSRPRDPTTHRAPRARAGAGRLPPRRPAEARAGGTIPRRAPTRPPGRSAPGAPRAPPGPTRGPRAPPRAEGIRPRTRSCGRARDGRRLPRERRSCDRPRQPPPPRAGPSPREARAFGRAPRPRDPRCVRRDGRAGPERRQEPRRPGAPAIPPRPRRASARATDAPRLPPGPSAHPRDPPRPAGIRAPGRTRAPRPPGGGAAPRARAGRARRGRAGPAARVGGRRATARRARRQSEAAASRARAAGARASAPAPPEARSARRSRGPPPARPAHAPRAP